LANAQDTIFYNQLVAKKVGESIKIRYKSVVTGGKQTSFLSNGKWVALDSIGNVLIEANYTANKRKKSTQKDGLEIFIDPSEGDTILIRNFRKGKIVEQLSLKESIFVAGNTVYHCYKDFESFTVAQYTYKNIGKRDFTTIWKSSIEDPNNVLADTNYLELESKIGDPSLLQPSNFNTKSRYNYVSNPEFEVHPKARFSIMSFKDQVDFWTGASESPDFYLTQKAAFSGSGFVGFRVFSMVKHIEYLQNQLKEPLKKNSVYCFSAYVKLSAGSKYATNAFGFLLTDKPQRINTDELLKIEPSKRLNNQILNYKTRWMKVQCTYTAKGGEQYLVLGSFQNHKELELVEVPGHVPESYYYLDDVSLVPVKTEVECGCNFSDQREEESIRFDTVERESPYQKLSVGDKVILDNVHFENDKAELLPESFSTLFEVLTYLQKNQTLKVEISGHTSSIGGLEHNMKLSKRRAKAVKTFLTLNGVEAERIETEGYGPRYPIANDKTEAGQKENRRVEFKVLAI